MSEWISVEDSYPKKRGAYLTWQPEQSDAYGHIDARMAIIDWTGNRFRSSFSVSHWMPLPEPPK